MQRSNSDSDLPEDLSPILRRPHDDKRLGAVPVKPVAGLQLASKSSQPSVGTRKHYPPPLPGSDELMTSLQDGLTRTPTLPRQDPGRSLDRRSRRGVTMNTIPNEGEFRLTRS